MRHILCQFAIFVTLATPAGLAAGSDDLAAALRAIQAVGPAGSGTEAASRAWAVVARQDTASLPEVLAALDEANPLAANWIRTAVDAIVQRAAARGAKLPADSLLGFVQDRSHAASGRQLAYELLCKADPHAPERLLPDMLDDPCPALRRLAVERLADEAARFLADGKKSESLAALRKAFSASRDLDQAQALAARLRATGEKVALTRHFGFVFDWQIVGPFDNTGGKGFDAVHAPQRAIDLNAAYPGKHGEVGWKPFASRDENGLIDLNKACGEEKDVLAYAMSEFFSPSARPVEIRYCISGAAKVWLNGRLIDQRLMYHGGSEFDQFCVRTQLSAGRNVILVKLCQNEQTQDWARDWCFRLRVCDDKGTAVLSQRGD